METRKTVFCEVASLTKFFQNRPYSDSFEADAISRQQVWNNVWMMLYRSNIWLDCNESELLTLIQDVEYLKYLWKQSTNGACGVECGGDDFPDLRDCQLDYQDGDDVVFSNAIYFTEEDHSIEAKSWGVINLTPDNYQEYGGLFKDNGTAIRKGEETDWTFLKTKAFHNLNSLVIVDNYVLKRMKNNLIAVLDNLLPQKLKMPLTITIFSMSDNVERDKAAIVRELKHIRPNLRDAEVEIFKSELPGSSKFFHDRAIISNNILISVGAGFDLFRTVYCHDEADKTTNVAIVYPFIQPEVIEWADGTYSNILKDAKKCLKANNAVSHNYLLKIAD